MDELVGLLLRVRCGHARLSTPVLALRCVSASMQKTCVSGAGVRTRLWASASTSSHADGELESQVCSKGKCPGIALALPAGGDIFNRDIDKHFTVLVRTAQIAAHVLRVMLRVMRTVFASR